MAEPVIARRCHHCGASIREAALFCPECGSELPQRDSRESEPVVTTEETITGHQTTVWDTLPDYKREERNDGRVQSRKASRKKDRQKSQQEPTVKDGARGTARGSMSKAARSAVGARIQRATTLARDVE